MKTILKQELRIVGVIGFWVKPEPQVVRDGPNQFRPVVERDLSCPGYILRSNKQGFIWKQVCSCCPRLAAYQYYPSELRGAA